MAKKTIQFEKRYGYLFKGGRYYELDERLNSKTLMQFIEVKDAEKKIKKAKSMAEKLKESLDRKKVLTESIMKLDKLDFDRLEKLMDNKVNYKPKTREHRCVDLKIGNFVLPIVD